MTDTSACGILMHRPVEDLYGILGLEEGGVEDCADRGYQLIRENGELTADQRYAWKALSDPWYHGLYDETRDTAALYQAGFFDDGLPVLDHDLRAWNTRLATTPLHKLTQNSTRASGGRLVVLVTTGGMAPIHDGHITMMNEARRILENDGHQVVAGYLAPGHDGYVGKKYGGTAAIPAEHRCAMVELATRDSDWLDCDPWAARYLPAEINFTSVVRRLQAYIRERASLDVEVAYVYGSDNAGFGDAIPGLSVCVERTAISSKMAREGNVDHLDPAVRDYLASWRSHDTGELPYLIRNEENKAIARFSSQVSMEELEKRRIRLQSTVRLGIAQVFKTMGHGNRVHLMPVVDQVQRALDVIGDQPSISLDPFFQGTHRLDSTRYFAVSESQATPLFRAERLGHETLRTQASKVTAGEYLLVEDDTVTGGTIAAALEHLPKDVRIVGQVILSDLSDYVGTDYLDVVDLRDFIVGASHGGLGVVMGDGSRARAPYALPYVSLRSRAKIPAQAELEISRIIWRANVRFFSGLGIKIRDCDEGLVSLAQWLGFDAHDDVEDFCQWHVDALMESSLIYSG